MQVLVVVVHTQIYSRTLSAICGNVRLNLYQNESEDINMKVFTEIVHYAWALMGGFVGWFLGGFDGFLYALLVFVAIDYLTGVMVAILEKKLSSSVGFRGIFKKILIFCATLMNLR